MSQKLVTVFLMETFLSQRLSNIHKTQNNATGFHRATTQIHQSMTSLAQFPDLGGCFTLKIVQSRFGFPCFQLITNKWVIQFLPRASSPIISYIPRPVESFSIREKTSLPWSSVLAGSRVQLILCTGLGILPPSTDRRLCSGIPAETNSKLFLREAVMTQDLHRTQVTIPTEEKPKFKMNRAHRETHICGRESSSPKNGETHS